jgi:hypothetical protein
MRGPEPNGQRELGAMHHGARRERGLTPAVEALYVYARLFSAAARTLPQQIAVSSVLDGQLQQCFYQRVV